MSALNLADAIQRHGAEGPPGEPGPYVVTYRLPMGMGDPAPCLALAYLLGDRLMVALASGRHCLAAHVTRHAAVTRIDCEAA